MTASCVLGSTQAGVVLAVVRIAKFLHPELILADFSKRSSAPFHQYTSSLKQCLYDLAENNPISEFRVISGHCRCYCYYNCPLSNQRKLPESFFTASIPSAKPFFFLLRTRPNDSIIKSYHQSTEPYSEHSLPYPKPTPHRKQK